MPYSANQTAKPSINVMTEAAYGNSEQFPQVHHINRWIASTAADGSHGAFCKSSTIGTCHALQTTNYENELQLYFRIFLMGYYTRQTKKHAAQILFNKNA